MIAMSLTWCGAIDTISESDGWMSSCQLLLARYLRTPQIYMLPAVSGMHQLNSRRMSNSVSSSS
jgi:hypothetical protein